jgi:glycosyltransferase involved in cell wall biosynthesis
LKAIVATGFGKLYFHETARALAAAGVEVNFLTGWVPKDNQTALVNFLGKLLGEKHLATRMAARQIGGPGLSVTPVAWVEVAGTFIKLVQRTRVIPLDLAYGMEFRLAAWGSRKYLKDADVLLVRSGAGQSGAIIKARSNGLAIVTDHSIAHPNFMHRALREEFARIGLAAGYDSRADLWKLVLRDCADADLLLVNSDFVKKTFVEQGYPADKVRVAYLGVREEFFDLKRDYQIDGPVNILFTGNFDVRKGVRLLLEAIRCCRGSTCAWSCWVIWVMGRLACNPATTSFSNTRPSPHSTRSPWHLLVPTSSSSPLSPKARRVPRWRPLRLVCPSLRPKIVAYLCSMKKVRSTYRRTMPRPSLRPLPAFRRMRVCAHP